MSFDPDNIEHELSVTDWLEIIAKELKLLNARQEAALETGIEIEGIEDGD